VSADRRKGTLTWAMSPVTWALFLTLTVCCRRVVMAWGYCRPHRRNRRTCSSTNSVVNPPTRRPQLESGYDARPTPLHSGVVRNVNWGPPFPFSSCFFPSTFNGVQGVSPPEKFFLEIKVLLYELEHFEHQNQHLYEPGFLATISNFTLRWRACLRHCHCTYLFFFQ